MHLLRSAAIAICLCAFGMAHADTITTFSIDATLQSGTVTGTVTLDATTGAFTASAITVVYSGATYQFSGIPTLVDEESSYTRVHFGGAAQNYAFGTNLPVSSLVGYDGGSLCSMDTACGTVVSAFGTGNSTVVDPVISGSLTPTPEPSGLALLGTGLLGAVAVVRRRAALSR